MRSGNHDGLTAVGSLKSVSNHCNQSRAVASTVRQIGGSNLQSGRNDNAARVCRAKRGRELPTVGDTDAIKSQKLRLSLSSVARCSAVNAGNGYSRMKVSR